ncbi:MAG TPA: DUF3500 domain-containing protein [Chloroflexota bacterium]|nr:DUF3500 domain-containing protein [Chloroflexota bacterium]
MTESRDNQGSVGRIDGLVERIAEAAASWLASLAADQRAKAAYDFPVDEERTLWYYTPTERGGLPFAEMDPVQQRLAHRLVASGLSAPGYATAATIMGLENVLDAVEGWRASYPGRAQPNRGRDPQLYFVSVFGEPGSKSWGWRLGGHHLSVSYTIVDGRIASPTPLFFGANPAESRLVGPGVLRPLAGEEDLGRELLRALDPDQLARAVLAPAAPTDIVQSNRPVVEVGALPRATAQLFGRTIPEAAVMAFLGVDDQRRSAPTASDDHRSALRYEKTPKGLPATRMTTEQRALLTALIRQYVDRLPEDLAEVHAARLTGPTLEAMHFAWAGGSERRQPHYYRVQGPHLLIEYDDTQNDANHIHAVWRDPEGDFGADLLAEHYRHAH